MRYANGRVPSISKERAEFVRRVSTEAMREFNRLDTIATSSNNGASTTRSRDMESKDDYEAWYTEAMRASNEAGFVGFSAAETIRALAKEVKYAQAATSARVYLVNTGEVRNGLELYERHDVPVPLAEYETLYTVPPLPMQPVIVSEQTGIHRFKENRIVSKLVDHGNATGYSLNHIGWDDYTPEERMQLAQLIGYSVDGYGSLPYVSEASHLQALAMSKELAK